MENNKINIKNLFKFIIGTLFGVFLVLIPFNFNGKIDTPLFYFLKLFIKKYNSTLILLMVALIVISALLSLINLFIKDSIFSKGKLMKNLFVTTPFYVANRILGAIIAILVYFKVGPEFIISVDTGDSMLSLATQLSVLVPMMLLFQTFILEFGAMEFIGQCVGFIVKPIFKVSEICATSIISAWVGPGNAAIMATKELFDKNYFTVREAAIISSQFTTGSIGWVVVVSSVMGVIDYFGQILLGLAIISVIVGFVAVRIPPISKYSNEYKDSKKVSIEPNKDESKNLLYSGLVKASERAETVTLDNFKNKINNMSFYILWLTPIIVCWGTLSLILALYTPVLKYISIPVEYILIMFNVPEAELAASAIMSGFADNYLPVILSTNIVAVETKIIVAMMSILTIVYLSETATLLSSTKIVNKFSHILIIFLQRTFISLPFVIIFVKFFIF
ncbi:YjiH family protein [Gemelliphila palaticanis]|uniref:Arginine transporter n=1 Tax=Gemelliphila palaticanis TaxID=81950 RepID=A0ABX2SWY4_9BACL|nr:arginine transporter [Gemella palaticanis]MBF0714771.1 arginine transporter [Gemella palaticanis]NYS46701.1 arginine transporter [Gemella palaticanis]